ncbi:ABC transporter permease [Niallia nealsonii]|uniref:ABC transporter permease n=1 Tax=Niallia nealsonii TaxID=115979 RepID=A0A2N0Z4B0_9BACI|nr:ABC transporter permease [Niallia nealsonii]PKG24352.1 ABC transporter permease [Niallia nealsonii]
MIPFILKRCLFMIPTLLGVTIIVFLMLQIVPGDPVNSLLSPDATEADRKRIEHELGFDKPVAVQYVDWLGRTLEGDFGRSIIKQLDVNSLLFDAMKNTIVLAFGAALFSFLLSLVIGIYSAYYPKSWIAVFGNMIGLTGVSIPNFWAGLILIGIFSVELGWFPSAGMKSVGGGGVFDTISHLILPAIAVGMTTLGVMTRMIRSSVVDLLQKDFIITLQAKGTSSFTVLLHVLKNCTPTILTVAGLQVGYLIGGSVLVETVFAWPGVGQLIYQAISQRDFPIIQAGVLVISIMFVLINLIVDILHAVIDPRIRHA